MSFALTLFMHLYLVRENRRRDEEMKAKGLTLEDYTDEMKAAERERGDYATVSRYHLTQAADRFSSLFSSFSSSSVTLFRRIHSWLARMTWRCPHLQMIRLFLEKFPFAGQGMARQFVTFCHFYK